MSSIGRITTTHHESAIDSSTADEIYQYIKQNVAWHEGVPSKKEGPTRKAYSYSLGENVIIDSFITQVLINIKVLTAANVVRITDEIEGIYINYYRDGNDFCPMHSHDTKQIVISLGASRTLMIGKKEFNMRTGDAIEFGKSLHGIRKDTSVTEGRISIALFIRDS